MKRTKIDPAEARARVRQRKKEWLPRIQARIHDRLQAGDNREEVARYVYQLMRQNPYHARSLFQLLDDNMREMIAMIARRHIIGRDHQIPHPKST